MTSIEWTDRTWNPVRGCSRVSEGCRFCYAERSAVRFSAFASVAGSLTGTPNQPFAGFVRNGLWTGRVELVPEKLSEPLRWRRPARVFVNSMSDLFHEALPEYEIACIFEVIEQCPQHTLQILTKRAGRMRWFFNEFLGPGHRYLALPNVHLGVSVEDQATADERVPILLDTTAAVRFVSAEPLLGAVELRGWFGVAKYVTERAGWSTGLHWVIVGGESGPGARPCDVGWIRSIVQQCKAAGVPAFVKQLGAHARIHKDEPWPHGWPIDAQILVAAPPKSDRVLLRHPKGGDLSEWPEDLRVREFPR